MSAIFAFACAGEEIWVEDPKKVWALASLVSQHNTILKVKRRDTGDTVDIDLVSGRATWRPSGGLLSVVRFWLLGTPRESDSIIFGVR